ncbi:TIGR01777 family oxidoreductase [Bacillus safensis]|uniref:TIGR01777 family oxidoreductase n=1 Tax=Bacillus safensis TaxID=561879 RepID=UPI00223864A7|nr:TIGR01777 family oxidoreductase [Bacillus safensis]MCW4645230.1 TIGR01777 family oxidoreductase [Bacillus safensis]MCY7564495.1 TIGR01777 family oxidoreductase [Bacillus safensis]MCY7625590.1 TIGR01777 family oxidoreductase [Bacillus safensis]MCY7634059.1 TIGR01777 family oxidoreductase [Bacillus safensis]MCY7647746.1 TIGR01777 family oxidoreductase [Bacillus safensis]
MNIAITGGTGFIGQHVTKVLAAEGHHLYILTRNPKESEQNHLHYVQWLTEGAAPEHELPAIDVWINLAGKSIFTRWTDKAKEGILSSRLKSTQEVRRIIEAQESKPSVLIQASAVGIYGTSQTGDFTEESPPADTDFLSHTSKLWEAEGQKIEALGIRTVYTRFGVVLGEKGTLPLMTLPYKLFAGGTIGSGSQWVSWVHVEDVAHLIAYAIHHDDLSGPLNATSPNPVQMKQLGQTIASALHRPHWLKVPSFVIKTALGEMSLLVLEGQRALPKKALLSSYDFLHPELKEAILHSGE